MKIGQKEVTTEQLPDKKVPPSFQPLRPPESPYELDLEKLGEPADWSRVYGRTAPFKIEIGCGGGRTAIGMAVAQPECNFLGIERAGEYFKILRERADRRALSHFRICRIDAAYLIKRYFANASVDEYHIYFPDPWPKKKHHKRRLFTPEFCADIHRTLKADGVLYFATDHEDYYRELLPRMREVLDVQEHPAPWPDAPEGRTNYEVKYMKAGRPIYRFVARQRQPINHKDTKTPRHQERLKEWSRVQSHDASDPFSPYFVSL